MVYNPPATQILADFEIRPDRERQCRALRRHCGERGWTPAAKEKLERVWGLLVTRLGNGEEVTERIIEVLFVWLRPSIAASHSLLCTTDYSSRAS